jgi:hypothetical protein
VREEGLYIWAEKKDTIIRDIEKTAKVDIILEKRIGDRSSRVAFIKPGDKNG